MTNIVLYNVVFNLIHIAQEANLKATFNRTSEEQRILIRQQFNIPDIFIEWYSIASPHNLKLPISGSTSPALYGADELSLSLEGYSYNAITGEEDTAWDPTWLVIGGQGEYPLIVHTAQVKDERIYYGEPIEDGWHLTALSDDLTGLLRGITIYIQLYSMKYASVVRNEHRRLKQEFLDDFATALDQYQGTRGRADVWLKGWMGY